jgi:hypothetical protein
MFENKTRVLLILPADVLERTRILAGRATTKLKLTVSVQIVLRALIEEGLKRADDRALLANIENQAQAVRRARGLARRRTAPHTPPRAGGRRSNETGHWALGRRRSPRPGDREEGRKR